MKFQLALAAALPVVLATPCPTGPTAFQLVATNTDSTATGMAVQASISNLWLGLSSQNATCLEPLEEEAATFYLRDGGLYLYSTKAAPQIIYADRSGMGTSLTLPFYTCGQGYVLTECYRPGKAWLRR
jgi:hypothetical protein